MGEDYYEILGIPQNASDEEIKKAYKKRATECHPDKPTGSDEKFKQLVKAYTIISNPESRKIYDRKKNSASSFTSHFSKVASVASNTSKKLVNDFVDEGLFDTLDKFLGRKKEPKNIEVNISVTIEELYYGQDKQIKFKRAEKCGTCSGSGAKSKEYIKMCVDCYGLGHKVSNLADLFTREKCAICKGTGRVILEECTDCKGEGEKIYDRDFEFSIPEDLNLGDMKERDTLILHGEGEYGGDVVVKVDIKNHKYYEVKWPDLYINLPVKFYQAILGDRLEIKTLRGAAFFKLPPGTEPGDTIVLSGYGLHKTDKNGIKTLGDLYISISVILPKRINKKQKELLEQYKNCDKTKEIKPKINK